MFWHIVTSEYPPQPGGVSDYTHSVAAGLAAAGDEVHVWCPGTEGEAIAAPGVAVHRALGRIAAADLGRVGRMLNQFDQPRRLLVQWVPHGYGCRAMNVTFCLWLWYRRYRHHDRVELMIHEPFLPFRATSWRQNVVALTHRLMTIVLLNAASSVWMSIPGWEKFLRPYAVGKALSLKWLPVTSNIAVAEPTETRQELRGRYSSGQELIVGHFGTCDRHTTELLLGSVPPLLKNGSKASVLLLGRGSEQMKEALVQRHPEIAPKLHASGELSAADLSRHIGACDVMMQPYIDGVSSRRTSLLVALAHGLPIVTTAGELTESLWAESAAVSLAPAVDLPALVAETRALLLDEAERRRLSNAARTLYHDRFDLRHTIALLRNAGADEGPGLRRA